MRPRLAFVLCAATLGACSHGSRVEPSGEPHVAPPREPRPDAAMPPGTIAPPPPGVDPTAVTPAQPPAKIKIVIRTTPPKVFVSWGKKKLGLTPLTIERPRDSGPVDLVLRASGYFPTHTRAYTVKNDVIGIKMTKLQDRMTLFGARQEIPPDDAPGDPSLDPNKALAPPAPAPPVLPPPAAAPSAPAP